MEYGLRSKEQNSKVQISDKNQLAEPQLSLNEYCNKLSTQSDFYRAIGDICCAQFSEDCQWYCTSVLVYASEKSAVVAYVDYGNFEILKLKRFCPMALRLLELPMEAIKYILAASLTAEETVNIFEWTWVELALNETVNVMVCMLYNPGEFYCHIFQEDEFRWHRLLRQIMETLLCKTLKAEWSFLNQKVFGYFTIRCIILILITSIIKHNYLNTEMTLEFLIQL